MNKPLRALIIEDSEQDARLLLRELAHGGYSTSSQRVETAEALRTALSKKDWDIVFCDFSLPKFSGQEALAMVRKEEDDLPFIFVSGTIGEEVAVEAMKSGAHDYVMKDNLVRLVPAVRRELREAEEHRERRRAEEAMRNSENKYRHLFESLSDAAFLLEKESGRIIDTNRQAEILLGLPRGKILGLNREQVFRVTNGGSDLFALSGRMPVPQCEALVTQAGTEKLVPVFASFSEVEIHGHKLLLVLARDITERKRAEEQLRKLSLAVEQSPTSILITDSSGNIEYVNPKFTKVTGYSLEEVRGKNPRFLKSGKMSPDFYRELWETITSGNEWHGELQNKRKDGAFYWEYVSISPVVDSSGRITHYVAVKEDVTEKKLLEARFLRAQRLESIGELAGGIAHDLNNILTPVLMGAAMLRHTIDSEEGLSLVSTIETSARRGSDIVKQVLTFARGVQGDRILLHPEKLVKEMGKIIQETFPKSIQLKMEISGNLWTVLGDATQLHQILMNLTVNARDAMSNGGVLMLSGENVTLDEAAARLIPGAKPGKYVLLRVSDTGTGIPQEIADKIFDPFFTTKSMEKGTGLGLSTALGIVKSHHGFIQFSSKAGQGTTFEVYLPAKVSGENGVRKESCERDLHGRNEMILLVDDEEAVRSTTKLLLEYHRYRTLIASNGLEALALYSERASEIDLVVTDLNMPSMGGIDTVTAIQKLNPRARIIVTSGAESSHEPAVIKRLNVSGFLKKPFDASLLLKTLHNTLRTVRK